MNQFTIHKMTYDIEPSYIKTMALERINRRLAVLRFDHRIEIWNLNYTPVIEQIIYNKHFDEIETVGWSKERLFATSLNGSLLEYDLSTLSIKHQKSVTSGAAWCIDFYEQLNWLAVGTDNGYINLFKTDNNEILYEKLMDKQEGAILSLKFNKEGDKIVTGGINAIRIWDVETGHAIEKINQSHLVPKKETIIWSLSVTSDFTIISGDSHGYLTFWNGNSATQIMSHKTHKADIMSIALRDDEQTVYCSGVDPEIISYSLTESNDNNQRKTWIKSYHRNIHDRDVRCLILLDNKLYSGGFDTNLICSYGPPKTTISYPPTMTDTSGSVLVPNGANFLLFKYGTHLDVWEKKQKYIKILELHSKLKEVIICAAISSNGKWIAYSTASGLRLHRVIYDNNEVRLNHIKDLPDICSSCSQIIFTPDNKNVIISPRSSGNPVIINLKSKTLGHSQEILIRKITNDFVSFMKLSVCGQYLAVATRTNTIIICQLYPKLEYSDKVPKYSLKNVVITAMAIQPTYNNLIVAYSDHKIIEYSIEEKQLTKFSEYWFPEILALHEFDMNYPILNIMFYPRYKTKFLIHSDTSICIVHKVQEKKTKDMKKLKTDKSESEMNSNNKVVVQVLNCYKHLVHFDNLVDDVFVAVEIKPLDLMQKLQQPYRDNLFGMM